MVAVRSGRRRPHRAAAQFAHNAVWPCVLRTVVVLVVLVCRAAALRRTVPARFGLASALDLDRIESALLRVPGTDSGTGASQRRRFSAETVDARGGVSRDTVAIGALAATSQRAFLRGTSCLSGPTGGPPPGGDDDGGGDGDNGIPASPEADVGCAVQALREAWQLRQQWLRATGDPHALTAQLQSPPPAYHILLNLGIALHMRSDRTRGGAGGGGSGAAAAAATDRAAALRTLREAVRLAPDDADCQFNLALVLLQSGHLTHTTHATYGDGHGYSELRQAADSARVAAQMRPTHA